MRFQGYHRCLLYITLIVVCVGLLVWGNWSSYEEWFTRIRSGELALAPVWLVLGIGILPLAGFPICLLYLYIAFCYTPGTAVLTGMLGASFNMSLGYFIARGILRNWLTRFLSSRGRGIPTIGKHNTSLVICLVRITPGIPMSVQNYILGISKVPFKQYMLISLPIQWTYMVGFVFTGGSIFQGETGKAILGGSIMASLAILAKIIYNKHGGKIKEISSDS